MYLWLEVAAPERVRQDTMYAPARAIGYNGWPESKVTREPHATAS